VLWNPAATALFGYNATEALQMHVEELFAEPVRPQVRAGLAGYAIGESTASFGLFQLPGRHKNGSRLYVEVTVYPLGSVRTRSTLVLSLMRDATERRRLEHERIARQRLEGAVLAVRTVQHEINNQLSLTVGYVELLSRHPDLPGSLRSLAEEALQGALGAAASIQRMGELTELRERDWGNGAGSTIDLGSRAAGKERP
jgi:PAS domain S-box-containing protein